MKENELAIGQNELIAEASAVFENYLEIIAKNYDAKIEKKNPTFTLVHNFATYLRNLKSGIPSAKTSDGVDPKVQEAGHAETIINLIGMLHADNPEYRRPYDTDPPFLTKEEHRDMEQKLLTLSSAAFPDVILPPIFPVNVLFSALNNDAYRDLPICSHFYKDKDDFLYCLYSSPPKSIVQMTNMFIDDLTDRSRSQYDDHYNETLKMSATHQAESTGPDSFPGTQIQAAKDLYSLLLLREELNRQHTNNGPIQSNIRAALVEIGRMLRSIFSR